MQLTALSLALTRIGLGGFGVGSALNLDFTSGNQSLDPRITFSRASNATVTGPDGVLGYAPHNLLTFSEQFDNATWTKTRATVTANAIAAPDGAASADKLISSAELDSHFLNRSVTSAVMTLSVFAKQGEFTHLKLTANAHNFQASYFNLSTGEVAQQGANHVAVIADAGNGWYRCSITPTDAFTNIYIENSGNSAAGYHSGDGTSGIFIWGAQLELGSTATTYNPTTVKNLLGFTEHFDNAAWTKSNSFVQTNLLLRSEEFDSASWNKQGVTVAANTHIAPDGTTTAEKIAETATTDTHVVIQTYTALSSAYTASVFVKADERGFALFSNGTAVGISVDLSTGVATSAVGSPTNINSTNAGNGWYRVSFTFTPVVGGNNLNIYASTDGVFANRSYAGTTGSGIFIWGAQLVQGTTPGDYKATYAAAAAVGYPDIYGQPFAQKLVESTASGVHVISGNHSATAIGTYTYTLYAKSAGENRLLELHVGNGISGAVYAFFDLDAGTVKATATSAGTGFSAISASITPANDSFYRCAISLEKTNTTGSVNCAARLSNGGFNLESVVYTGDGTSGIFIFGAQLSDSASVDPYVYQPVAAPTSTAYYGPRFDYDPVTLAPKGLLIEEQRTNLATYSSTYSDASWAKANIALSASGEISPISGSTATKVSIAAATAVTQNYKSITIVAATSYTVSVFAKAGGVDYVNVGMLYNANEYGGAQFNLSTGNVVTTFSAGASWSASGATISPMGNGWFKCSVVMQSGRTPGFPMFIPSNVAWSSGRLDQSLTGNGTDGIHADGFQFELGAVATSYIPTVASQVTRAADSASMIGNNFARWYNQTEGTVYVEADTNELTAATYSNAVTIWDGTSSNRIVLRSINTGIDSAIVTGGAVQASLGHAGVVSSGVSYKLAFAMDTNDIVSVVNGSAAVTDNSATLPVVNTMVIGGEAIAGSLSGHIARIAYYNRRLANTELQAITS